MIDKVTLQVKNACQVQGKGRKETNGSNGGFAHEIDLKSPSHPNVV